MNYELLKQLTYAVAPSGAEGQMRELIASVITPLCDEVKTDKVGNLIATIAPKKGKAKEKLMLLAHMDEVGFMVQSIDNDGRLRLAPLGDVDTRTLSGRRVVLTSGVKGVVASKPIHMLSRAERGVPTAMKSLYIELGTKDKAETETLVHIGDYGTYEPKFTPLKNGKLAGKAMASRGAVLALIELIQKIKEEKLDETMENELVFVFSVKREIARRQFAVETAAYTVKPDRAIILDAEPAADFDGVKGIARGAILGKGAVILPADMKTIYDRELFAGAVALCTENGISYQYTENAQGAGNEAGGVHRTGTGIPSLSIGIPTRNYRSGAEIIDENDLRAAFELLCRLVK